MVSERLAKRKLNNLIYSVLLMGGMILVLSLLGWIIGGILGFMFLAILGGIFLFISPHVPPRLILRMYHARPLTTYETPWLLRDIDVLSNRANLPCTPSLYYIPTQSVNAFAIGKCNDAAIGVTDGLLRHLNRRELVGVLAHEISHLRDNDLQVMGLANLITRATSMLSWIGQILFFINLPLILLGGHTIPWLFILLLIFAPTISSTLQLALSRAREYDADLDAVQLTGDPRGLAYALAKLENLSASFMERVFLPGRRMPEPSLFRTHPSTEERIRRLLELEDKRVPVMDTHGRSYFDTVRLPTVGTQIPRWVVGG